MTESISARLLRALDCPEIPKYVQRRVHNLVCGINAEDPHEVKWKVLYDDVMQYLKVLRSNKSKVRPDLREAWQEYYDTVACLPAQIRESDQSQPIPKGKERWQGWVPESVRKDLIDRFDILRQKHQLRGSPFIPFAPLALRQENDARIAKLEVAIASARSTWNTKGTPTHPASHLPVGAVILAACRQAEREIVAYKKRKPHPYEEPAKVKWQDYCDTETRAKVRRLMANPADVYFDMTPYQAFYKP